MNYGSTIRIVDILKLIVDPYVRFVDTLNSYYGYTMRIEDIHDAHLLEISIYNSHCTWTSKMRIMSIHKGIVISAYWM